MAKILDLTNKLKVKKEIGDPESSSAHATLFDMTESRQEMIQRERREVKRTLLSNFIGAFAVLPERGLLKVTFYDISDNGLAFDTDSQEGGFSQNDEIAMRVYINHKTYFPFNVRVLNSRKIEPEGVIRHGAHLVKDSANDVALHHFVKFVESVSTTLLEDDGDIVVSHIS